MKNKITVFIFIIYIMFFSIFHLVIKDNDISKTERRKLSNLPNIENILNIEFSNDLEQYLLDHFPFRDGFRSIKANYNYHILNNFDNNNIYLKDNYIFKSEYPTNKKSISNFITKTNILKDKLTLNNNTYMMIIPDKNYYLEYENFLQIDYEYIKKELTKLNIETINIEDILSLEDYYETDTHWKQEKLDKVIKHMSKIMNFNYKEVNYTVNTYNDFYGVYYGESAINRKPETLTYLTNDIIDDAEVKYLENNNLNKVYNIENLTSLDSYEVYLDGASSYIEIINNNSNNKKKLVVFRDSFGSSLVPLLIEYYNKITIIDNRYITSKQIDSLIHFTDQDILFLYSTMLVNNSYSLKG